METYKELLGICIKSKKTAYINGVCTKSASKDSLNCFTIFGSSACQGQHVLSMSFLTCTAPCTDWSRDFIRSRAPYSIYTKQVIPIRSRTFRVGHPATRSRAFGVGHSAIRSRAFEVGHPAIQSRAFGVGYSKQDQQIVCKCSACRYSKQGTSDSYVSFLIAVRNGSTPIKI